MKLLAFWVLSAVCCVSASAQHYSPESKASLSYEEAERLMNDTHYYAASQSLKEYLSQPSLPSDKRIAAEELMLICDYYLQKPGTAERIYEWLEQNPHALYADRLALLRANLLVKEDSFTEALSIYQSRLGTIYDMYDAEREETMICYALSLINNDNIDEADVIILSLQNCKTHQMDMVYYLEVL